MTDEPAPGMYGHEDVRFDEPEGKIPADSVYGPQLSV
jgi:hypothetical protein